MKFVFEAKLLKIGSRQIIVIPLSTSKELPSRGMVMIQGIINNFSFIVPLEPDGKGSHRKTCSDRHLNTWVICWSFNAYSD